MNHNDQTRRSRRRGRSMLGPIILISLGIFFLLQNSGNLPGEPNWTAVLQLWPVWLIIMGINLIVRQAPRPVGGLLSGMVSVGAVTLAAYLLFFSEDNALLARWNIGQQNIEFQRETISFVPEEEISRAEINLDLSLFGADIYALETGGPLIAGEVSFINNLNFDSRLADETAVIQLDSDRNQPINLFSLDLPTAGTEHAWNLGLSPDLPLDLRVETGVGAVTLNLQALLLEQLTVSAGAGRVELILPDGEYEFDMETGVGNTQITFPQTGQVEADLQSGAGNFTLLIPPTMAAQIELDGGVGNVDLNGRFTQIRGDSNREGIWQTPDFETAENRVEIKVDLSVGALTVSSEGR